MKNTRCNTCTGARYAMPVRINSVKLKLTLTLTDTGGAVLTLMLGYRSLEKIASRILHTTQCRIYTVANNRLFSWFFECVCCCQCISCSLCILCAGVPVTVNKRQLCTGSRALDTAVV